MRIGTSIFLLAVGAILRFAVYYSVRGVAIGVVGIVLMAVGALGLLLSLTILGPRARRRTIIQEGPGTTSVSQQDTYEIDEPVNW
jgi:hypothetical protein